MRSSITAAIVLHAGLQAQLSVARPLNQSHSVIEQRASSSLSTVYTKCNNQGDFALTFDDGPYKYNSQIVKELADGGAMGTFFMNGNNYDCIYDQADAVIAAYEAGHTIGSHTWDHSDISKLSASQLNAELDKVETAFKKILGVKPKLFRPPYGSYNDAALKVLKQRGYSTIVWSMDSGDSVGKSTSYSEQQYQKQASAYPAPGIGLNHETYKGTADTVVPYAVKELTNAGYKLVTVAECLGLTPYEYIDGKEERNDSWKC